MERPTNTLSRDADKFIVRMPDGLRARIAVAAAAEYRSMNAEIVRTLEQAFPGTTPKEAGK